MHIMKHFVEDKKYPTNRLSEKQALMILNALPLIGAIACKYLLEAFDGNASAIFDTSRTELLKIKGIGEKSIEKILNWTEYFELEKEEASMRARGIEFYSILDPKYPKALHQIYDPPIGLYCLGNFDHLKLPCVAIIGTRTASLHGRKQARRIARELSDLGFCIISGMARGIDGEAHQGAIEGIGSSVAVLGNGLDIIYPPEHLDLSHQLEGRGAIISEFPLGRRADRKSFPIRNRIIAGLSQGVIVVESGVQGGSMITANAMLENGRPVMAIPGRIDHLESLGCLNLIKDGATLIASTEDILIELKHTEKINQIAQFEQIPYEQEVSLDEAEVLELFKGGERLSSGALAELIGQDISLINAVLTQLELKKIISKRLDGLYEIR